jgi:hypothetical protein
MYYSYIEIEYVATSFSPARTDLALKLLSVNKMAENGYTTIFRPGDEGVTIHKKGTLTITTSDLPCSKGEKERSKIVDCISSSNR